MAATPRSAPEAALARAPLVVLVVADAADDDPEVVAAALPTALEAPEAALDEPEGDALLSDWLTSAGTLNWPLAAAMLTDPSAFKMLGLAAKNARVYLRESFVSNKGGFQIKFATHTTFSAMRGCAQSGMEPMSMLLPQDAAIALLLMLLAAYMAEMVELLAIMAGIMDATELGLLLSTLGALMIPNMPFSLM